MFFDLRGETTLVDVIRRVLQCSTSHTVRLSKRSNVGYETSSCASVSRPR